MAKYVQRDKKMWKIMWRSRKEVISNRVKKMIMILNQVLNHKEVEKKRKLRKEVIK